jgi:hypothetical protein
LGPNTPVEVFIVPDDQCGWIRALREVSVSKIIIIGFQYYYGTEKYGFGAEGCSTKKYDYTLLFHMFWPIPPNRSFHNGF